MDLLEKLRAIKAKSKLNNSTSSEDESTDDNSSVSSFFNDIQMAMEALAKKKKLNNRKRKTNPAPSKLDVKRSSVLQRAYNASSEFLPFTHSTPKPGQINTFAPSLSPILIDSDDDDNVAQINPFNAILERSGTSNRKAIKQLTSGNKKKDIHKRGKIKTYVKNKEKTAKNRRMGSRQSLRLQRSNKNDDVVEIVNGNAEIIHSDISNSPKNRKEIARHPVNNRDIIENTIEQQDGNAGEKKTNEIQGLYKNKVEEQNINVAKEIHHNNKNHRMEITQQAVNNRCIREKTIELQNGNSETKEIQHANKKVAEREKIEVIQHSNNDEVIDGNTEGIEINENQVSKSVIAQNVNEEHMGRNIMKDYENQEVSKLHEIPEGIEQQVLNLHSLNNSVIPEKENEQQVLNLHSLNNSVTREKEIEQQASNLHDLNNSVTPVTKIEQQLLNLHNLNKSVMPENEIGQQESNLFNLNNSVSPEKEIEPQVYNLHNLNNSVTPEKEIKLQASNLPNSVTREKEIEQQALNLHNLNNSVSPEKEIEQQVLNLHNLNNSVTPEKEIERQASNFHNLNNSVTREKEIEQQVYNLHNLNKSVTPIKESNLPSNDVLQNPTTTKLNKLIFSHLKENSLQNPGSEMCEIDKAGDGDISQAVSEIFECSDVDLNISGKLKLEEILRSLQSQDHDESPDGAEGSNNIPVGVQKYGNLDLLAELNKLESHKLKLEEILKSLQSLNHDESPDGAEESNNIPVGVQKCGNLDLLAELNKLESHKLKLEEILKSLQSQDHDESPDGAEEFNNIPVGVQKCGNLDLLAELNKLELENARKSGKLKLEEILRSLQLPKRDELDSRGAELLGKLELRENKNFKPVSVRKWKFVEANPQDVGNVSGEETLEKLIENYLVNVDNIAGFGDEQEDVKSAPCLGNVETITESKGVNDGENRTSVSTETSPYSGNVDYMTKSEADKEEKNEAGKIVKLQDITVMKSYQIAPGNNITTNEINAEIRRSNAFSDEEEHSAKIVSTSTNHGLEAISTTKSNQNNQTTLDNIVLNRPKLMTNKINAEIRRSKAFGDVEDDLLEQNKKAVNTSNTPGLEGICSLITKMNEKSRFTLTKQSNHTQTYDKSGRDTQSAGLIDNMNKDYSPPLPNDQMNEESHLDTQSAIVNINKNNIPMLSNTDIQKNEDTQIQTDMNEKSLHSLSKETRVFGTSLASTNKEIVNINKNKIPMLSNKDIQKNEDTQIQIDMNEKNVHPLSKETRVVGTSLASTNIEHNVSSQMKPNPTKSGANRKEITNIKNKDVANRTQSGDKMNKDVEDVENREETTNKKNKKEEQTEENKKETINKNVEDVYVKNKEETMNKNVEVVDEANSEETTNKRNMDVANRKQVADKKNKNVEDVENREETTNKKNKKEEPTVDVENKEKTINRNVEDVDVKNKEETMNNNVQVVHEANREETTNRENATNKRYKNFENVDIVATEMNPSYINKKHEEITSSDLTNNCDISKNCDITNKEKNYDKTDYVEDHNSEIATQFTKEASKTMKKKRRQSSPNYVESNKKKRTGKEAPSLNNASPAAGEINSKSSELINRKDEVNNTKIGGGGSWRNTSKTPKRRRKEKFSNLNRGSMKNLIKQWIRESAFAPGTRSRYNRIIRPVRKFVLLYDEEEEKPTRKKPRNTIHDPDALIPVDKRLRNKRKRNQPATICNCSKSVDSEDQIVISEVKNRERGRKTIEPSTRILHL